MKKIFTGKTIEEAVENAARELGLSKDGFSYEVTEFPKKGFLGFGSAPAKITVNYEISAEDKVEEYLSGLFNIIGLEGCKTSITVEGDNVSIQIDGEAADLFLKNQEDLRVYLKHIRKFYRNFPAIYLLKEFFYNSQSSNAFLHRHIQKSQIYTNYI